MMKIIISGKEEVCQVRSRNKIFILLILTSSKNQERSFQVFLNRSRIVPIKIFKDPPLDIKERSKKHRSRIKEKKYQES